MGKTTSANIAYPAYQPYSTGSVAINGDKKATVSKSGNEILSNYNMNEPEKQMYDYAQSSMAKVLPQLNVFDDSTKLGIQSQVESYKQNALKSLDEIYKPMLTSLKNDIASRFGGFDNSMFMDNLGSLENYRASALSQLSQDANGYQSDLYNNELSSRYNYINLLNSLVNGTQNNALNYVSNAFSNANSGNSYNAGNYNTQRVNAMNATKYNNNLMSNLGGSIGDINTLANLFGF